MKKSRVDGYGNPVSQYPITNVSHCHGHVPMPMGFNDMEGGQLVYYYFVQLLSVVLKLHLK